MATNQRADAVVIGAGHNGLVAATYLARAGLRVRVVERRDVAGGATVTEELWPGYRISRASYVAGLLRPAVVRELGLTGRGLRLLARSPSSFTPLPDGRALTLGPGSAASRASIHRFSPRDAARYPEYEAFLDRIARALEPALDAPPPALPRPRLRDLPTLLRVASSLVRLGRALPDAAALLLGAARPILERWFESEPLRSTLATDAVIGAWAAPSSPGTGYVLFHHVMGETNGHRGVWAYVEGGMGALASALVAALADAGGTLELGTPVARVQIEGGRARGVVLEDGREIGAEIVVSNADPARTLALIGRAHVPEDYARGIDSLDFRSPTLKLNLALAGPPQFRVTGARANGIGPEHHGTAHLGTYDLDALERSYTDACAGRLPERPMIELTLPSAVDPTLAPAGRHVASLFVQHVPYTLAGTSWEAERERFADRVLAIVDEVAPGFSSRVLHRDVLAPPDLERIFGLTGGNLFHGAMTPDRLFPLRPFPGHGGYATPIEGLWLCGAGTHPGGGVMGACGRNAAAAILRARGRRS